MLRQANAIVDLEGLPFDDPMRAIQERVIRGELTFGEAIDLTTIACRQINALTVVLRRVKA